MVSSQLQQIDASLNEVVSPSDADFAATGLKVASVLRLSRLAVLDGALLMGSLGAISNERLQRIRQRLAAWILAGSQ